MHLKPDKSYIFSSAFNQIFLSIEKLFLRVIMLRADFLIDQGPYGQKLNYTPFRYCNKVFKNIEFHH
jgi:hypothetical protein